VAESCSSAGKSSKGGRSGLVQAIVKPLRGSVPAMQMDEGHFQRF